MNRSSRHLLSPTSLPRWLLAMAICLWLALIAGVILFARSGSAADSGSGNSPLPDLRSSLHLPYFSFARALRPGS